MWLWLWIRKCVFIAVLHNMPNSNNFFCNIWVFFENWHISNRRNFYLQFQFLSNLKVNGNTPNEMYFFNLFIQKFEWVLIFFSVCARQCHLNTSSPRPFPLFSCFSLDPSRHPSLPLLLSYKSNTRRWPALTAILYPPPSPCLYAAAPLHHHSHHHPISNLSSTAGNLTVSRNLPAAERRISQLIYRSPEPCAMPRPGSGALYAGYVKLFSFQ